MRQGTRNLQHYGQQISEGYFYDIKDVPGRVKGKSEGMNILNELL
jgi:hypothetical protein